MKTRTLVYQIHFIGWSKKWDIWSKEINILRWTRENLKKKDELMMTQVKLLNWDGPVRVPWTVRIERSIKSGEFGNE